MDLPFKSGFLAVVLVVVAWNSLASGQTSLDSGSTLFPSPEHQKMNYFAGDWALQGTMKPNPNGSGGDFTATEHSEWVAGGFFLHTRSNMHSPDGDVRSVRVTEYNAEDKVYTSNDYNSLGGHQMAIGRVLDNTWMWTSDRKTNGVIVKVRYTITIVSPVTYAFKYETLTQAGAWTLVMEGKATKSQ